ncbi:MAG: CocE/NonD family hydrolase [Solirubrobacteraceae bacterium]
MAVRSDFPRPIRRIDHMWIPLADGTRLSARIWLPEDAEQDPVPAILEYLPYRKGDAFARRDSRHHPYFAGHGYAGVRVDLRGTGDSDGIIEDEYLPQEQEDAIDVIAWLAQQSWCSGAVGMLGISWGGFNGLQVAARRPPALEAVISMCASDDRYADDVHYVGGCVLAVDMLPWAATMLTGNALPPDQAVVGDGWRETWLQRIERTPPFIEAWLAHQRRDGYWRQGSVCEHYDSIDVPVYAIGGWADGYSNAIPRLIEGLPGPRKGLIGPWSHAFPQDGAPGPAIGFLQECLRWFDQHLKGIDTGVMDEPRLRAWMQEPVAPATHHTQRPGRWVSEPAWPPPDAQEWAWDFSPAEPISHRSVESTGLDAGAWCADGGEGDWPGDQRAEDERSLTFTSAPLDEPIEILGFPEVTLGIEVGRPSAIAVVRLCDVDPDGASLLVTRGVLNLNHRDGHDSAKPLEPGQRYEIAIALDAIAQRVPAGHRLRVAVSTAYWPWVWPAAKPVTLTLHGGRLAVPTRPPRAEELPDFGPPEWAPPLEVETIEPGRTTRVHSHDQATGEHELRFEWDVGGHRRLRDSAIEMNDTHVTTYRIVDGDPLSASVRVQCSSALGRGAWRTRVDTDSEMTATAAEFVVRHRLDAYEADERICSRSWTLAFPRDEF